MIQSKKISFINPFIKFPTPSYITYSWNYGSLLGLVLFVQLVTGIFLSIYYSPGVSVSFDLVINFTNDVKGGWFVRLLHSNGASMFFIFTYLHISKALFYNSSHHFGVWVSGVVIFLTLMGTAFLGYVLPWGQMSYWGATVITNLISVIPLVGADVVEWVWGGFNINSATLTRFYSFHFVTPFLITGMMMIHLILLHKKGSSNPLGLPLSLEKMVFSPYFIVKDFVTITTSLGMCLCVVMVSPYYFFDPENFMISNPLSTPPHIQPEWYFLFAYAILRSIPSKMGGVIMMLMSILILLIIPFIEGKKFKGVRFYPLKELAFFFHVGSFITLTWLGSMVVESPFVEMSKLYTLFYFSFYFI